MYLFLFIKRFREIFKTGFNRFLRMVPDTYMNYIHNFANTEHVQLTITITGSIVRQKGFN